MAGGIFLPGVFLEIPLVNNTTPLSRFCVRCSQPSWWWALLPALTGTFLAHFLFDLAVDRELWLLGKKWLWFPQWPVFGDLAVTLQHLGEAQRGLDPLRDPTSEFGYPRAVLLLHHLHLQDLPAAWLGLSQAVIWMAGTILILRPRTPLRSIITTLLFISPPIWLGLERGNVDLMLFLGLAVAAVLWARAGGWPAVLGPVAAVFLATLLKLYPAFVLAGGAWTDQGRRRLVWIGAIAAVGIYWLLHSEEMNLIMSKLHHGQSTSWGCLMIFKQSSFFPSPAAGSGLSWAWLIGIGTYGFAFLAAALVGHRLSAACFAYDGISRTDWALYWFGASVCCGSFLASNYAYRWVFALLTLPLLLNLARTSGFPGAIWARLTLAALAVSLGAPLGLTHGLFFAVQFANWCCILLLVVGYFALRPSTQPSSKNPVPSPASAPA